MSNPIRISTRLAALVAALATLGCAELQNVPLGDLISAAGLGTAGPLDDATIASGLKEALRVGTDRTVVSTSATDGFLGNALIRIALPDELERGARGLRAIGFGSQVDELERTMNRAAERAAREAGGVFVGAISQMSFADARGILQGGEGAATAYFRDRTSETLRARFSPIVDESMRQVGLVKVWDQVEASIAQLPLVPKPNVDLRAHVTQGALDGLFTVLGQEEARIRRDPAARTTELLRTVFGR